ncbi:MAG TPA: hypothetical protein VG917_02330 [Patescibacteria group bacterium]|nr:hypothetical protein [Patescibacteria group bacterium]
MTEQKRGLFKKIFSGDKALPQETLNPTSKEALKIKAEEAIQALSEEERNKMLEETKSLDPSIIYTVGTVGFLTAKFIRSQTGIIYFPSTSDHTHAEYAVINGIEDPKDAGQVSVNRGLQEVYFDDNSMTLGIWPTRNKKDREARQETIRIAQAILPSLKVSDERSHH